MQKVIFYINPDRTFIKFRYNPHLQQIMRSYGARWSPTDKMWHVPTPTYLSLYNHIKEHNYTVRKIKVEPFHNKRMWYDCKKNNLERTRQNLRKPQLYRRKTSRQPPLHAPHKRLHQKSHHPNAPHHITKNTLQNPKERRTRIRIQKNNLKLIPWPIL